MTYITRIVVALNPDGTHKGSAVYEAEIVGGRVYELDPRSIAAGDAAALSAAMSGAQAAAEAAVVALTAERDAAVQAKATAEAERNAALARVAELEAQLAAEQQADLPQAIRAERDRRIQSGVKVGDDWFHTDLQTQIQYLGMLMQGAALNPQTPLKTMAGVNVGATPQRVQAIFAGAAANMALLHTVADAAIQAGTPLDQIQWPPTYTPAG